jgi:hypothetical protein
MANVKTVWLCMEENLKDFSLLEGLEREGACFATSVVLCGTG